MIYFSFSTYKETEKLPQKKYSVKSEESTPKSRGGDQIGMMETSYSIVNVRWHCRKSWGKAIF